MWTREDSEEVLDKVSAVFRERPRQFFTEHDLHSHLYKTVKKKLEGRNELFAISKDEFEVSLVHHEYPTPFRCDMSNKDFKIVEETQRTEKGSLYRRGHYDLVVLNPDFIGGYEAVVVSGKNYKRFCEKKMEFEVSPVQWACEIVFGAHVEDGLPRNFIKIITQDAKKILGSLKYKVGKANFAVNGSAMVFFGIKPNERIRQLEENITKFNIENDFHIRVQTA